MGDKVDISEVIEFSDDLEEASSEIRSNLEQVIEKIDSLNDLDSFSGKAAKEAKTYFNDLHKNISESFRGLFDDLEENLNNHIEKFESDVDSSESAIITKDYLKDIKEDIIEDYEDLSDEDESISDTIQRVNDITSALTPTFDDIDTWHKHSVKYIKELNEDLSTFTGIDDTSDTKELLNNIESAMNNAKTSEGKARFADFEGASDNSELKKLMEYNEGKQEETMEKAKDAKETVLKDADESSKTIGNKAYKDFENGIISEKEYYEYLSTLQKIQNEPSEEELNEEVPQSFLEYLNENKVEFAKDTTISAVTGYTSKHGSMKLGGLINTFRGTKGDGFVMVNSKSNQYAQPFLNPKTHKWAVNAGKWGGRAAIPVAFGVGWYDDVKNHGKTHGQAIAHNSATTGIGIAATAGTLALMSNPGGWAILGAAAIGTGAAMLGDYFYKNNKTVETAVDWVGDRFSDIGEGFKNFFSGSNATNTNHSPGFNAP